MKNDDSASSFVRSFAWATDEEKKTDSFETFANKPQTEVVRFYS